MADNHPQVVVFVTVQSNTTPQTIVLPDTRSIIDSLKRVGLVCAVYDANELGNPCFFEKQVKEKVIFSRVNPGDLIYEEILYLELLKILEKSGKYLLPNPSALMRLGSKSVLVDLKNTGLGLSDTKAYFSVDQLKAGICETLLVCDRVLKIRRGSLGRGVWRVQLAANRSPNELPEITLNSFVVASEAFSNIRRMSTLGEFCELFLPYLSQRDSSLIDMRYLPDILNGEIRIVLVDKDPVLSFLKVPSTVGNSFGAGIRSGAHYFFERTKEIELVESYVAARVDEVLKLCRVDTPPILWTIDLIPMNIGKLKRYIISEINCSCVGFYYALDAGIQDRVANTMLSRIEKYNKTCS